MADASRLLERANARKYTMRVENGGFQAKVRIGGISRQPLILRICSRTLAKSQIDSANCR